LRDLRARERCVLLAPHLLLALRARKRSLHHKICGVVAGERH
jgi:hypothetical protein